MLLCALLFFAQAAQVDLPLDPPTQFVSAGSIVSVTLRATSTDPEQIAAVDAILSWDPAQLAFQGATPGPGWFITGFLPDPDGINLDIFDGEALYTVLSTPGTPKVTPPAAVVASFAFKVLATGEVSLPATSGAFGKTRVVSATPGLEITGEISDPACFGIPGTWTDLGNGLAGTGGLQPVLVGSGNLACEDLTTFTLTDALPGAQAYYVLGIGQLGLPFKGGVFVPTPDIVLVLVVPPSGSIVFGFPWPNGLPSGATLYYQYWIKDLGGPLGFSASNGIRSTQS